MQRYEYNVVPAPKKGKRAKGVKGVEGRFAHALSECMNEMAADGWEYLRTDTLPSEERSGLTGRSTVFQNMLVFRREVAPDVVGIGRSVDEIAADSAPRLPSATEANTVAASGTMADAVENDVLAEEADDEDAKDAAPEEKKTEPTVSVVK
ncbi:DUF4177 domain-containing protein [Maritimibacter sp. UBA3975]|uniref:DUF4177 domain-containing protein n=1 Tax=Maritimibacter sp. UBA3975 TaxID=1946833 RepID=UPI000C0AF06D|nr:DUF4177 domain-containing protein [Maritimibacter sp. UBA3975]MAM61652.1 DUF4177 domain-containing protein [Maritimibacter sp.]|tara:strand:+ start:4815 stop:5267 length:453 start_codon:yes stop_codon:yes gene_type:complete